MTFYRSGAALLCLLVAGCASNYQVSNETQRLRASLDRPQAEALLSKSMVKTERANGLCSSNIRQDRSRPQFLELRGGVMAFEEYDKQDMKAPVTGSGAAFTSLSLHRSRFELDLSKLELLRIVSASSVAEVCRKSPGNKPLGLKDVNGTFINVDVSAADFEAVLAALLVFSPQARLAEGMGL